MVPLELIMARQINSIFIVDEDLCYGCGACIALCPIDVLILDNRLAIVDEENCTHCKHCIPSCPVFALSIKEVVN
jgi:electron transport complex protein RnfB